MATYPRTQSEISALTESMIAGYNEHPGDFPSADVAALTTARENYETASEALAEAQAAAKIAAVEKAENLKQLQVITKAQLIKSQVDTAGSPEKLGQIGWGPKAEPQSMQAPYSPGNLKITAQGIGGEDNNKGILHLSWRKSAFKRARFVRYYSVERRQMAKQKTDRNGQWQHIATALDNKISLIEEPTGSRLEYRVKAVNKGGESSSSNTISVVL
jgi:hypothetical protein